MVKKKTIMLTMKAYHSKVILVLIFLISCNNENINSKIMGTYWLVATDSRTGLTFLNFIDTNTVITYIAIRRDLLI